MYNSNDQDGRSHHSPIRCSTYTQPSLYWRVEFVECGEHSHNDLFSILRDAQAAFPQLDVRVILRTWDNDHALFWIQFDSVEHAALARGLLDSVVVEDGMQITGPLVTPELFRSAESEVDSADNLSPRITNRWENPLSRFASHSPPSSSNSFRSVSIRSQLPPPTNPGLIEDEYEDDLVEPLDPTELNPSSNKPSLLDRLNPSSTATSHTFQGHSSSTRPSKAARDLRRTDNYKKNPTH